MEWIKTDDEMPPEETAVLIYHNKQVKIGELRWDHPNWEDSYQSYLYWDNPFDDGQDWGMHDVTHWARIPDPPKD